MKRIDNSECLCSFGEYIRDARELRGLTQTEVAEKLGITQSFYSLLERGGRNIDLVLALDICQVLNLNMKDFIKRYL